MLPDKITIWKKMENNTVIDGHPLLGKHVVLGAMRASFKYEIEDQISRLLKMPSSGNDPEFWKMIEWNRIGLEKGYIAVRKLVIGDPVRLIDMSLYEDF